VQDKTAADDQKEQCDQGRNGPANHWLRERDSPEVIAYLEAENAYTEAQMAHTEALQKTLYDELLGRIQETDLSVPV